MLGAPSSVEVVKTEGKNEYTFPKKSEIHFQFPARKTMPPVKIIWSDAATAVVYRPEGIPESELLFGGPDSFGIGAAGASADFGPAKPAPKAPQSGTAGASARYGAPSFPTGVVWIGDKGILTNNSYAANIRLLPESRHKSYKLPPQLLTRSPGHYRDWIRACKGGDPACSNFSVAGPFTEWTLLGAIAVRFEGKIEWDSEKMRVTNIAEANRYVKPTIRKGWEIGSSRT
jgi:hypothetical protein